MAPLWSMMSVLAILPARMASPKKARDGDTWPSLGKMPVFLFYVRFGRWVSQRLSPGSTHQRLTTVVADGHDPGDAVFAWVHPPTTDHWSPVSAERFFRQLQKPDRSSGCSKRGQKRLRCMDRNLHRLEVSSGAFTVGTVVTSMWISERGTVGVPKMIPLTNLGEAIKLCTVCLI